jgi:hypothetical protein
MLAVTDETSYCRLFARSLDLNLGLIWVGTSGRFSTKLVSISKICRSIGRKTCASLFAGRTFCVQFRLELNGFLSPGQSLYFFKCPNFSHSLKLSAQSTHKKQLVVGQQQTGSGKCHRVCWRGNKHKARENLEKNSKCHFWKMFPKIASIFLYSIWLFVPNKKNMNITDS